MLALNGGVKVPAHARRQGAPFRPDRAIIERSSPSASVATNIRRPSSPQSKAPLPNSIVRLEVDKRPPVKSSAGGFGLAIKPKPVVKPVAKPVLKPVVPTAAHASAPSTGLNPVVTPTLTSPPKATSHPFDVEPSRLAWVLQRPVGWKASPTHPHYAERAYKLPGSQRRFALLQAVDAELDTPAGRFVAVSLLLLLREVPGQIT